MPAVPHPLYEFTLLALAAGIDGIGTEELRLNAAYFVEDGSLLLFKDAAHSAVYGLPLNRVLSVVRGAQI